MAGPTKMDLYSLLNLLWPELLLVVVACVLFLMGVAGSPGARRLVPLVALLALLAIFAGLLWETLPSNTAAHLLRAEWDPQDTVAVGSLASYIKMIAAGMGLLFV